MADTHWLGDVITYYYDKIVEFRRMAELLPVAQQQRGSGKDHVRWHINEWEIPCFHPIKEQKYRLQE